MRCQAVKVKVGKESLGVNGGEEGIGCERTWVRVSRGLGNCSNTRPSVSEYRWIRGSVSGRGNKM